MALPTISSTRPLNRRSRDRHLLLLLRPHRWDASLMRAIAERLDRAGPAPAQRHHRLLARQVVCVALGIHQLYQSFGIFHTKWPIRTHRDLYLCHSLLLFTSATFSHRRRRPAHGTRAFPACNLRTSGSSPRLSGMGIRCIMKLVRVRSSIGFGKGERQ